ncbi:hypothetical protein, partial [Escherichia coli]|uniref:hypothetical protein n=1 Tax=Escherichia coli TaxID=562 RepID=UPI0019D4C5EC
KINAVPVPYVRDNVQMEVSELHFSSLLINDKKTSASAEGVRNVPGHNMSIVFIYIQNKNNNQPTNKYFIF